MRVAVVDRLSLLQLIDHTSNKASLDRLRKTTGMNLFWLTSRINFERARLQAAPQVPQN